MSCARLPSALAVTLLALGLAAAPSPNVSAHSRDWTHTHRHGRATGQVVVASRKPVRTTIVVNKHRFGAVDLNVKPKATEVWVDDTYHGNCAAYDGSPDKLYLRPGRHRLLLVTPEGVEVRREVRLQAGERIKLSLDLR